jgi:hypothetical protein
LSDDLVCHRYQVDALHLPLSDPADRDNASSFLSVSSILVTFRSTVPKSIAARARSDRIVRPKQLHAKLQHASGCRNSCVTIRSALEPGGVLRDRLRVFSNERVHGVRRAVDHRFEAVHEVDHVLDSRIRYAADFFLDEPMTVLKRTVFPQHLLQRCVLRMSKMAQFGGPRREHGIGDNGLSAGA